MLISCPECNTKVSDKAHVCPHCGFRIDTLIKCPDCGNLVPPETVACPVCGYPFSSVHVTPEHRPLSNACRIFGDYDATCPHCGAPVSPSDDVENEPAHSAMMKSGIQGTPIAQPGVETIARENLQKETAMIADKMFRDAVLRYKAEETRGQDTDRSTKLAWSNADDPVRPAEVAMWRDWKRPNEWKCAADV